MRTLLLVTALSGAAAAGVTDVPLSSPSAVTPLGVRVETAEYRGRKAMRVVEPKVNEGGGIALANGTTFGDGVIEAELAGFPAPGAREDARGFVGIAFRVQRDPLRYESFYLRPTNGRADDQLQRNHSTQYVSEPDFPWYRLRKEHPGVYESYVDLEAGAWTKVKVVVNGRKAQLFVHGAAQPALIVNDLKLDAASGGVGLFIGLGTEAYFTSLKITPE